MSDVWRERQADEEQIVSAFVVVTERGHGYASSGDLYRARRTIRDEEAQGMHGEAYRNYSARVRRCSECTSA